MMNGLHFIIAFIRALIIWLTLYDVSLRMKGTKIFSSVLAWASSVFLGV